MPNLPRQPKIDLLLINRFSLRAKDFTSRLLSLSLYSSVFVSFCLVATAYAGPLDDVLESQEMAKIERGNGKNVVEDRKWLDSNTNFSRLFVGVDKNGVNIFEWLGDLDDKDFATVEKSSGQEKEFVWSERHYENKNGSKFTVTALVPHPRYQPLVDLHLVQRFTDLEPPHISVLTIEKITVNSHDGVLYHQTNGKCSAVFKLPRGTVINFQTEQCEDTKSMLRLAQLLNMDRTTEKLTS